MESQNYQFNNYKIMRKYIGLLVVLVLAFVLNTNVGKAEDGASGKIRTNLKTKVELKNNLQDKKVETKNKLQERRIEVKDKRQEKKEEQKDKRQENQQGEKEKREDFREELKEKRETFREEMKTKREDFTKKLKTERETFRSEIKTKKEEWKKAKNEKKRNFCEKAKEMISGKFEFAVTEVEKLQTRVSEAILKLQANGKNTTLAQEALNLSKSKLADAKAKLLETKKLVPENGCENITPEIFEKIKLGAREAKDLLKESRESLRQAIQEIKNLKEEDENEDEETESENDNSN